MNSITLTSEMLSKYVKYKNGMKELNNSIKLEIDFWDGYENIPESMKKDIDLRLNSLERFGEDINVNSIEKKILLNRKMRDENYIKVSIN